VLAGWKQAAARLSPADVLRAVDLLGESLVKLREGREERLMVELAVIKLTRPETASDPAALVSRVDRLERRVASGAGPAPRPAVAEPTRPEDPFAEPAAPPTQEMAGDPQPDQPAPGSGAENGAPPAVGMDQFQAIWPTLFGGLRDLLGSRRWALFRETEPGAVEGNTLVVAVKYDFHLKALQEDEAVRSIVGTRAGDLLGVPVDVAFRQFVDGRPLPVLDPAAAEEFPAVDMEPDRLVEAPPDLTDPVKLIGDELGGTVVEEYDVDPEDS
jgi:hypothetical protein